MRGLTWARTHRIATAVLSTLLVCAVAAFAYWALMSPGKGSTAPTVIGKAPAPAEYIIEPSFTAGTIKPGSGNAPLTVKATNSTGAASQIRKVATAIAVDAEHSTAGCKASWFKVNYGEAFGNELEGAGLKTPITVPTGSSNLTAALNEPTVQMKEEAGTNQNSCLDSAEGGVGTESAHLTVTLTATP